MTTATLTTSTMASAPSSSASVGVALQELGIAAQHLVKALWMAFSERFTRPTSEPTPQQAAQELRVFASSIAASDPGFASDLFAAADRHEYGDNS